MGSRRGLGQNNFFIRGVRTLGRGIIIEIEWIFKTKLKARAELIKVRAVGSGIVAQLETMMNKKSNYD